MVDQITEVTRTGWGGRMGKSITGIIFGLVLLVVSFIVLYWNDGRVDISNLAKNAIPVSATEISSDPALQGEMVSVTGYLKIESQLGDDKYLNPGNYIAYDRKVEMYAWIEDKDTNTENNIGGSETETNTYTYRQDWTSSPENSISFKEPIGHDNPNLTIEEKTEHVATVSIGEYKVDMNGIKLSGWERLSLGSGVINEEKIEEPQEQPEETENEYFDSDGDGIADVTEPQLNTNPSAADTDGDGLDDGMEINVYKTDPNLADTDSDTFPDGGEISAGYDPLGDGKLSDERLKEIEGLKETLESSKLSMAELSKRFEDKKQAEKLEKAEKAAQNISSVSVEGDYVYVGDGSVSSPQVGDARISYRVIKANQDGTAFGKLDGDTVKAYSDEDGNNVHSLSLGSRNSALEEMH